MLFPSEVAAEAQRAGRCRRRPRKQRGLKPQTEEILPSVAAWYATDPSRDCPRPVYEGVAAHPVIRSDDDFGQHGCWTESPVPELVAPRSVRKHRRMNPFTRLAILS